MQRAADDKRMSLRKRDRVRLLHVERTRNVKQVANRYGNAVSGMRMDGTIDTHHAALQESDIRSGLTVQGIRDRKDLCLGQRYVVDAVLVQCAGHVK